MTDKQPTKQRPTTRWPKQIIGRPCCPACGSFENATRSSHRDKRDARVVHRHYQCSTCGTTFPVILYPGRLGVSR